MCFGKKKKNHKGRQARRPNAREHPHAKPHGPHNVGPAKAPPRAGAKRLGLDTNVKPPTKFARPATGHGPATYLTKEHRPVSRPSTAPLPTASDIKEERRKVLEKYNAELRKRDRPKGKPLHSPPFRDDKLKRHYGYGEKDTTGPPPPPKELTKKEVKERQKAQANELKKTKSVPGATVTTGVGYSIFPPQYQRNKKSTAPPPSSHHSSSTPQMYQNTALPALAPAGISHRRAATIKSHAPSTASSFGYAPPLHADRYENMALPALPPAAIAHRHATATKPMAVPARHQSAQVRHAHPQPLPGGVGSVVGSIHSGGAGSVYSAGSGWSGSRGSVRPESSVSQRYAGGGGGGGRQGKGHHERGGSQWAPLESIGQVTPAPARGSSGVGFGVKGKGMGSVRGGGGSVVSMSPEEARIWAEAQMSGGVVWG